MATRSASKTMGPWLHALAAAAAAVAINGIIFALGWLDRSEGLSQQHRDLPPDVVIGAVWVVLFALMGAARWQIVSSAPDSRRLARGVTCFMAWCLAYPFLTNGLKSDSIGLLANGITIGLNIALCLALIHRAPRAMLLMIPTIAWVGFASAALVNS